MTRKRNSDSSAAFSVDEGTLREILGYLNFSNGTPDAAFQRNVNRVYASLGGEPPNSAVHDILHQHLSRLQGSGAAFKNSDQAGKVLSLVFEAVLPAYWEHHADLLFPLREDDIPQGLFAARIFETVLEQGAPWDETERIIAGSLARLNDYVGYRPLAVLENDRRVEPYSHERFRPVPLYLKDAGVAAGRYEDLILRTIEFFRSAPEEILRESHFDLALVDELALDVRAHDHTHPVTKRTNYTFGEWDPHQIDNQGRYRRFVIRKIILDALLDWVDSTHGVDREELLSDASAVLCGTILMASSISGSGPDTHDSTVSLTSLLPKVARQRDAFYARLLEEAQGARAKRLLREAKLTQQPFGHVRQHLNIMLAKHGARQVQHRHLAQLFAQMGYAEASREQAAVIPSSAARFETEIRWRLTSANGRLDHGDLVAAVDLLREIVDLLRRGISCGAFVDPWNILGFQGQFPLFSCREDSIPDQRVLVLLEIVDQIFGAFSHALGEAASQNKEAILAQLSDDFQQLAEWWDRHATTAIEDLPHVSGRESWESGSRVSHTLFEWRSVGEASGDISFWRTHVDQFESAKAYALVVDALLRKQDHVAAMGLLMQWLSRAEDVGLESGAYSLHSQLLRWMSQVTSPGVSGVRPEETWASVRRLFDYFEANAGSYWSVPSFDQAAGIVSGDIEDGHPQPGGDEQDEELFSEEESDEDDDTNLFQAAYDDVVFRDSARDGHAEDTMEGGFAPGTSEMELVAKYLEPRIRLLDTLARLWQTAATHFAAQWGRHDDAIASVAGATVRQQDGDQHVCDIIDTWRLKARRVEEELFALCTRLSDLDLSLPSGDHDSNVEFDIQQQTKLFLLHTVLAAQVRFRTAERCLRCCLPADIAEAGLAGDERHVVRVFRGILRGDVAAVRRALPELVAVISRNPLLYIAFEHGGRPDSMRDVRMLQSVIRFLLTHLPRLGFLRETWQLLQTAYRMERGSRPEGLAVTEFDQLFRVALNSTLRCVVRSSGGWKLNGRAGRPTIGQRCAYQIPSPSRRRTAPEIYSRRSASHAARTSGKPVTVRVSTRTRRKLKLFVGNGVPHSKGSPERDRSKSMLARNQLLMDAMNDIVESYLALWLKHSRTMRLSSVEELNQASVWRDVKKFVASYGADLFHARMLTLGNIRTILHGGVERFLDYLDETRDPLHPIKLVEDLDDGVMDSDRAAACLELIYESLIDKFERFVEYNTTTTQSDYGEMIFCLLDFLRAESAYERDAWNLYPVQVAHEVLAELGRNDAALIWETLFADRSSELADRHLKSLARLEKKYGMRLPSLADHLSERFVKPMAVNRMLALVPRSLEDARNNRPSTSFELLRNEINSYLESTSGSAIDVPAWLKSLERAVDNATLNVSAADQGEPGSRLPPVLLSWEQTRRQLGRWR